MIFSYRWNSLFAVVIDADYFVKNWYQRGICKSHGHSPFITAGTQSIFADATNKQEVRVGGWVPLMGERISLSRDAPTSQRESDSLEFGSTMALSNILSLALTHSSVLFRDCYLGWALFWRRLMRLISAENIFIDWHFIISRSHSLTHSVSQQLDAE